MKINNYFIGLAKKYIIIFKSYQAFLAGKFFLQERNSDKADLLVKEGYIRPFTTRVVIIGGGIIDVNHHTSTKKGKRLGIFINFINAFRIITLKNRQRR